MVTGWHESTMTHWLRHWGIYVFSWAGCALGLGSIAAGAHTYPWMTAIWVISVATWTTTSKLQARTIRTQENTISLLSQRHKAMWS